MITPATGADPIPKQGYGTITFSSAALLFENLEVFNATALAEPQNMEPLGQGYGFILYEINASLADQHA